MMRTSIVFLVWWGVSDLHADFTPTSMDEGVEHTVSAPRRLDAHEKKNKPDVDPIHQAELEKEKQSEEDEATAAIEKASLMRHGFDADKSKLPPSGRNDASSSPGAGMRILKPEYLDVKVQYENTETSWWDRFLQNLKQGLGPVA
ncbi:MAG: hypothetical protein JSR85_04190 [Proteobacteria bacterium]|nr:hypothetical protein [Pseudomonadota bacterium]